MSKIAASHQKAPSQLQSNSNVASSKTTVPVLDGAVIARHQISNGGGSNSIRNNAPSSATPSRSNFQQSGLQIARNLNQTTSHLNKNAAVEVNGHHGGHPQHKSHS